MTVATANRHFIIQVEGNRTIRRRRRRNTTASLRQLPDSFNDYRLLETSAQSSFAITNSSSYRVTLKSNPSQQNELQDSKPTSKCTNHASKRPRVMEQNQDVVSPTVWAEEEGVLVGY